MYGVLLLVVVTFIFPTACDSGPSCIRIHAERRLEKFSSETASQVSELINIPYYSCCYHVELF